MMPKAADIVPLEVTPDKDFHGSSPSACHLETSTLKLDLDANCPLPLATLLIQEVLAHV